MIRNKRDPKKLKIIYKKDTYKEHNFILRLNRKKVLNNNLESYS